MELSESAAIALAQIIPILLLASYFDLDALGKIGKASAWTRIYWVSTIALILFGEMIAVLAIVEGGVAGWRGYAVVLAVILCLTNLFSIATWRMFGLDLISGLPTDSNKRLRRFFKKRQK